MHRHIIEGTFRKQVCKKDKTSARRNCETKNVYNYTANKTVLRVAVEIMCWKDCTESDIESEFVGLYLPNWKIRGCLEREHSDWTDRKSPRCGFWHDFHSIKSPSCVSQPHTPTHVCRSCDRSNTIARCAPTSRGRSSGWSFCVSALHARRRCFSKSSWSGGVRGSTF